MTFTGCGTALVTPMRGDGALDLDALRRLVDWQIESRIDFLVPCGSTGEAQTLTPTERHTVVRTVVDTAAGRVSVLAGATDNDTRRAVEETRAMNDLGVDGILSATPYYNKPTPDGLRKHFEAIADASSVPVVLYNVPGRTALNMRPATVLALAAHPRIIGIKEASGDLLQAMAILGARPEGFLVLSGEDALAVAMVAVGGDGLISVTSNAVPAQMTAMTQAARSGELGLARRLLYQLLPLIDAHFIETNPGPVKASLALLGRIEDILRLPLVPCTAATRDLLQSSLARATKPAPTE